MIIPLAIAAMAVLVTLAYASVRDIQERRVPFKTWYPMLAIGIPAVFWFYLSLWATTGWSGPIYYLVLTAIFSCVFYLFARLNLFGGADAWALIFLSVCVPSFPWEPIFGYSPLGFLPFSVLVNALIVNLLTPVVIFLENLRKGNRTSFPSMFFGFPVPAEALPYSFGFIMEEIEEADDGRIRRRFPGLSETVRRMLSGERRVYTKDLRLHPEEYARELSLYRRAGTVWISYGVPFIVPIAVGMVTAIFFGDILFTLMKLLAGV